MLEGIEGEGVELAEEGGHGASSVSFEPAVLAGAFGGGQEHRSDQDSN